MKTSKSSTYDYYDYAEDQDYKSEKTKYRSIPAILPVAVLALIAIVSITNIGAWHDMLGAHLEGKFARAYTLGGLLIHPAFGALFRIAGVVGLLWFYKFNKTKKGALDYVGTVLAAIAIVIGLKGLITEGHWALAVILWFIIQCLQFEGIFGENSHPVIKLFAFSSYIAEYAAQCHQSAISNLSFYEFIEKAQLAALTFDDIFWLMALLNLACMFGVEMLCRFIVSIRKN